MHPCCQTIFPRYFYKASLKALALMITSKLRKAQQVNGFYMFCRSRNIGHGHCPICIAAFRKSICRETSNTLSVVNLTKQLSQRIRRIVFNSLVALPRLYLLIILKTFSLVYNHLGYIYWKMWGHMCIWGHYLYVIIE